MERARVLSDFDGRWDVTREITPATGPGAAFEGQAVWQPAAGGAEYAETGILRLGSGAPMTAERRYFWTDTLAVLFEDGRFFHQVPARGGEATHFCDPDTYIVTYDFSDWPVFRVSYAVTGPRKDYAMVSRYSRALVD